jgi:hypothetical protein
MFRPDRTLKRAGGAAAAVALVALAACADGGPTEPAVDPAFSAGANGPDGSPPGLQDRGPLERVTFIHYKRGFARPPWAGGGGGGGGGSTCFAFIANGAGWRTAEPWEVYNGSDDGVTQAELVNRVSGAIGAWETAAGANIAGTGGNGTTAVNLNATDNRNVVQFGSISSSGAIAVTNVWGFFRGPTSTREIVEWDMILDDRDFSWSTTGAANAMDVLNIVTHEIGHALGMGHPENTCTLETMYAFATEGEIIKRDLHDGDIAGIIALY